MSIFLLVVAIGVVLFWRKLSKRFLKPRQAGALYPEALDVLSFDDDQISLTHANGEVRTVRWAELTMVGIRTTDEGPFLPDVFWGLHGADKKPAVVYAQGATGEPALLEALQSRLNGFDNQKVIEAMGCTDNAFFLVWEKS